LVDPGPSPSVAAAGKELLEKFRARLSPEERQLAEQRALGRSWTAIAAAVGAPADGLRMQLNRALDRVARELKLDE
jgi:DNA-directed RNA polymerase specialized sigma24 family protein